MKCWGNVMIWDSVYRCLVGKAGSARSAARKPGAIVESGHTGFCVRSRGPERQIMHP